MNTAGTVWHGTVWHGTVWHGMAGTARRGMARQGVARRGLARRGGVRQAGHGVAGRGRAWHGWARQAWQGSLRSGRVWCGEARQARQKQRSAASIPARTAMRHNRKAFNHMNFSPVTLLADGAPPIRVRQQPYQDEFLTTVEIGEYGSEFQLTVRTSTADNGVAEIASFAASILEAVGTLASAPTQLSDAAEDVAVMLADRRAELAGGA